MENERFKRYIAELARLRDYQGDYRLSERQAWRKKSEDCYVTGCLKANDGNWYYRFEIRKRKDAHFRWAVKDLLTGDTEFCWSFADCRAWAENRDKKITRYVKEVYQPGMTAYKPDGKTILIDAVESDDEKKWSVWYRSADDPMAPQEKLSDITSLYIAQETAEQGFTDWLRKVSLDSDVFDRVGEDEIRKKYRKLTELLIRKGLTVSTMESVSGGQVASLFTDTEGSSAVLKGAFVTYSNDAKEMQGVARDIIDRFSVYSFETAAAMARACRKTYDADFGIGVTGTAGNVDSANPGHSVPGQVYLAVAKRDGTNVTKKVELFGEDRYMFKIRIAGEVLELITYVLNEEEDSRRLKTVYVRVHPRATQCAHLVVPSGLSPEEERNYISLHLAEAEFAEPVFDYTGADFLYYETAEQADTHP